MARERVRDRSLGWQISPEATRLLERLADRLMTSPAAVIEDAIREKARRESVTLDEDAVTRPDVSREAAPPTADRRELAQERLRVLVNKVRAGEEVPSEELAREVAVLRTGAEIVAAPLSGSPDPEWQERFQRAVEAVRSGVPEEWTPEEIEAHVAEAISEVRASRARDG
jgi:hypothetical protein